MYRILLTAFLIGLCLKANAQNQSTNSGGQVVTVQPKIMVIPFSKENEDMRTILDSDPVKRVVISKVKEAFDKRGFTTVDYIAKLKAAKEQNIFTSLNQQDIKSQLVIFSGADIYVETDVIPTRDGAFNSIQLVLSGNESSTGNSLANKSVSSGAFQTDDFGLLGIKAADKIADDFLVLMQTKFNDIVENGKSIVVNFSLDQNSKYTFETEIPGNGLPFSDVIDQWMQDNAYKNYAHSQGALGNSIIYDDVRIPLKDQATKQNYNTNKFALLIFQYLKSLGISSRKEVKSNTIYMTIL